MNIAIVDDDKIFAEKLKILINKICENNQITHNIDIYCNGYDILENYEQYHVTFLDIDMPQLNGLDTAKKINAAKKDMDLPFIVFVTSKDNLVFEALKCFPYSFIRKSYIYDDIKTCIIKIYNQIKNDKYIYSVKVGRKLFFINLNDVFYLEKEKNYINYYTSTECYRERGNIEDKINELIKLGFIRTHIGYIVNAKHIKEITTNALILDNGNNIPISKKFKDNVKNTYLNWLVNKYV